MQEFAKAVLGYCSIVEFLENNLQAHLKYEWGVYGKTNSSRMYSHHLHWVYILDRTFRCWAHVCRSGLFSLSIYYTSR